MKSSLLILGMCSLLYSCCTKVDCVGGNAPEIIVRLEGFSSSDLSVVKVLLLDTNSYKAMDSISLLNESNFIKIDNWILGNKKIDIKDYAYLIRTNISSDTINQVKYEKYTENIKCNTCFPFGDGSATIINYKGFSFQHERIKYSENDTLTINK